jgi:NAD(P)-dependent dehydrogenase (short-subunit alcohol dehydrogenase family)
MADTSAASRVALVTGGGRGIGRGCARALARAGFDIALVDILVPEMEITAAEIRALGRRVLCIEADVADHARDHVRPGVLPGDVAHQVVAGEARDRARGTDHWPPDRMRAEGIATANGEFGADMAVSLLNDGPVTIVLDVPPPG